MAKIYPEPETGGRSKKATGSGKFPEVAQQRVSEARTVLQYSTDDDLVRDVLSGAKPLDTAYQVALERKKDAELSDESRLEELRSFYAV